MKFTSVEIPKPVVPKLLDDEVSLNTFMLGWRPPTDMNTVLPGVFPKEEDPIGEVVLFVAMVISNTEAINKELWL